MVHSLSSDRRSEVATQTASSKAKMQRNSDKRSKVAKHSAAENIKVQ